VVIDFGDGFQPVSVAQDPAKYGMYFKRSWVTRRYSGPGKPRSVGTPNYAKKRAYFPMSYSIAEEFLLDSTKTATADVFHTERKRPVVCTLRPMGRGNTDVRKAVLGWVGEAVKEWSLKGSAVGEVDHGGRREIQNKNYLQTMREARIVVTANPTGWEGDSRTWEALASGALVMVDHLECPLPHPLIDGVHVVYYDPMDKDAFLKTLKHYLDRPDEARRIGLQGYVHALQHHRTVNRADYLLHAALFHRDNLPGFQSGREVGANTHKGPQQGRSALRRRRLLGAGSAAGNGTASASGGWSGGGERLPSATYTDADAESGFVGPAF